MLGYLGRILVVGMAAAVLVGPATQLVAARAAERVASPTEAPSPSPSPSVSPTQTASPAPTETPTPKPTSVAAPKPTSTAKPTHKPTAKPDATNVAKDKDALWNTVVWSCLVSTDTAGCLRALDKSGIALADLRARIVERLDAVAHHQAGRADLELHLEKCVASGGIQSDACMRAWTLSGLSLEEFKAIVLKKMQAAKPTDPRQSEREKWLQKCIDSRELYGEACYRAWELSGMSSEEFDKKITAVWASRR